MEVGRIKGACPSFSADAVNNMSGLGFNGYNSKGDPHWDRLSNVNILQIEVTENMH